MIDSRGFPQSFSFITDDTALITERYLNLSVLGASMYERVCLCVFLHSFCLCEIGERVSPEMALVPVAVHGD